MRSVAQNVYHFPWRVGDETSRILLDLAANRPASHERRLTTEDLRLAQRHGLLGLLAHSPDRWLREPATPLYLLRAAKRRTMKAGLRRVLLSLRQAGVPAAVLKGPYVAADYRNPALRTFGDLDLLVRREDLNRALEVVSSDPAVKTIPPKRPRADKRDVPFRDPSGGSFNLDLHWDLFSYSQLRGCARHATASAWDEAVEDPDHELGPLWHLPAAAQLGFLCTHAILDHRFRLILFRDLAEFATDPRLHWEEIVAFARQWGLSSVTYVAWLMAAHLVQAQVPPEALVELRPSNLPTRLLEMLLPRTDVVRFDGHRPHPVNLVTVLLHDQLSQRAVLAVRAPLAAPGWRRRVEVSPTSGGRQVTIVVTSNRRRGAEVFGERLRDGLTELGWESSLISLATATGGGSTVDAEPVQERPVGELGRLDGDVVLSLRRRIRDTRPRIVIANGSATLQYSVAATFALRHRPAVVYMSIGEPRYWMQRARNRVAHRLLLSRVDLILAVSRETARQLIDDLGVPPERVRVAHTGVPGQFLEIEPDQADQHELRLLFLGSLSAEKGPLLALDVLSRLSMPARLRLVGSGPLTDRIHEETERLGFAGRVEVTEAVADVRPHLAWADLLILTSRTEGLPGAVLEAAAAGLPTVAFDVGGTGETVVDGQTGRLVPFGDLVGMARAIEELADPERRAVAGLAAREMIGQAFNLERSVRHHHELLLELLGEVSVDA